MISKTISKTLDWQLRAPDNLSAIVDETVVVQWKLFSFLPIYTKRDYIRHTGDFEFNDDSTDAGIGFAKK